MQEVQVQTFRSGRIYKNVLGIVQDNKTFRNQTVLPWRETFTDSTDNNGVSYQIEVPFEMKVDEETILDSIFTKVVAKGGTHDKVEKLKLKPGDRIRFTARYTARKGNLRWFTSFEILHPNHVVKLSKSDDSAI